MKSLLRLSNLVTASNVLLLLAMLAALIPLVNAAATTPKGAPPAGAPPVDRAPNIVLIAIDTLRPDRMSCYGYPKRTTPNIDKLAADGVLFENCYSPASWTLPAFMSVITGVLPVVHGCTRPDAALPDALPTLPERLRDKGYFCAAVVSNPFMNGKYGFGRGFAKYDDFTVFLDAELASVAGGPDTAPQALSEIVTGRTVGTQARRMFAKAKMSGKPFFLFVHFYDPHDSYIPPAPYDKAFTSPYAGKMNGRGIAQMRDDPPAEPDRRRLSELYDGEIAYEDAEVGKFVSAVDAASDPRDTIVILISDHGEAFGEHRKMLHGNSAYVEEARVPMIWRWAGRLPPGHRVRPTVSTLDLAGTLRDLLRLEGLDHVQGQSLWPGLNGGTTAADRAVLSETAFEALHGRASAHHVAVTQQGLRLHARFGGPSPGMASTKFELYDVLADPSERADLAASRTEEMNRMRLSLSGIWDANVQLRARFQNAQVPSRVKLDEKESRRLKGLGYTHDPSRQ